MRFKNIRRILFLPYGLVKGLLYLANEKARDMENTIRFPKSKIDSGSTFSEDTKIGHNCHILKGCTINKSLIGNYTYVNYNTLIQNCKIGNYCSISNDVIIGLGAHPLNLFSTSPLFYKVNNTLGLKVIARDLEFQEYKEIVVGNDVWIGARAIIMDGINIGDGAVIAAGSTVTKNVPPYAIFAGVPAKLIRFRHSEEKINKLLKSKWWLEKVDDLSESLKELNNLCL